MPFATNMQILVYKINLLYLVPSRVDLRRSIFFLSNLIVLIS